MVIDFKWTLHEEGVIADRPTAGTDGRIYYATDEDILYYDNGLAWTSMIQSGYTLKNLFDANTILKADIDNTPEALTVAEQRLVGRITDGVITALTATQVRTLLNVEDGAAADLTGAEIVTLLEALAAAARLSHNDGLSDLATGDPHTQYILKALLTTRGDIIYRNATVPVRLAKGTEGQVLTMGADDPGWAAAAAAGATSAEALCYALSN